MGKMNKFEKFLVNSKPDKFFRSRSLNRLLKDVGLPAKARVLEVGCGVGHTSRILADRFPDIELTATDYDEEQIELAKQQVQHDRIKFEQADAADLQYEDSSFDVCFALLVIHHVLDWEKAVDEIYRVLKPRGQFLVEEPSPIFTFGHGLKKEKLVRVLEERGFVIKNQKGRMKYFLECEKD